MPILRAQESLERQRDEMSGEHFANDLERADVHEQQKEDDIGAHDLYATLGKYDTPIPPGRCQTSHALPRCCCAVTARHATGRILEPLWYVFDFSTSAGDVRAMPDFLLAQRGSQPDLCAVQRNLARLNRDMQRGVLPAGSGG